MNLNIKIYSFHWKKKLPLNSAQILLAILYSTPSIYLLFSKTGTSLRSNSNNLGQLKFGGNYVNKRYKEIIIIRTINRMEKNPLLK